MPAWTAPLSCVLFVSVSSCRFGGNWDGRGFASALLSRCSSVRAVKPDRSEGRLPAREVEDRSLDDVQVSEVDAAGNYR